MLSGQETQLSCTVVSNNLTAFPLLNLHSVWYFPSHRKRSWVWLMGMVADRKTSGRNGEGRYSWGFGSLIRRKQVDSVHLRREGHTQLARKLSAVDLVAIGKSCYNLCLPQFRMDFEYEYLKFVIFGHVGLFSLCKLCSYLAITFVNWISFFVHVVICLIEVSFFVHVFICLVCNGFVTICFLDSILRQLMWHFNFLHSPPSHDVSHFIHNVKNALFAMFMNSFWGFLIPLNHCYSG